MVAFEFNLSTNVDAGNRARCQRMRSPHPQSIRRAWLNFSLRRYAERKNVRRDF